MKDATSRQKIEAVLLDFFCNGHDSLSVNDRRYRFAAAAYAAYFSAGNQCGRQM